MEILMRLNVIPHSSRIRGCVDWIKDPHEDSKLQTRPVVDHLGHNSLVYAAHVSTSVQATKGGIYLFSTAVDSWRSLSLCLWRSISIILRYWWLTVVAYSNPKGIIPNRRSFQWEKLLAGQLISWSESKSALTEIPYPETHAQEQVFFCRSMVFSLSIDCL